MKERKTLPHQPGHWNKKKQLEVVTTYLALGNLSEASRLCNVPLSTVEKWKMSPWWKEVVDDIQNGEGQRSDSKMSKIIDKALDMLEKRIEDGDYQYDQKTGRLVKVPLKARDLERVASGLFDKRQLIRKKPTHISSAESQSDMLKKLAEEFAKFSGQISKEKVVDEYIDETTVEQLEDGTFVVKE